MPSLSPLTMQSIAQAATNVLRCFKSKKVTDVRYYNSSVQRFYSHLEETARRTHRRCYLVVLTQSFPMFEGACIGTRRATRSSGLAGTQVPSCCPQADRHLVLIALDWQAKGAACTDRLFPDKNMRRGMHPHDGSTAPASMRDACVPCLLIYGNTRTRT